MFQDISFTFLPTVSALKRWSNFQSALIDFWPSVYTIPVNIVDLIFERALWNPIFGSTNHSLTLMSVCLFPLSLVVSRLLAKSPGTVSFVLSNTRDNLDLEELSCLFSDIVWNLNTSNQKFQRVYDCSTTS